MLARVELLSALTDNDLAGTHKLVCKSYMADGQETWSVAQTLLDLPENFFRPSRLPGDPPWLCTVPPARLVAVRTAPKPVLGLCEMRGGRIRTV